MKTFLPATRPALLATLLAGLMIAGMLLAVSGCDIGGCNCDDDMDDFIAKRGQPDTFDIVDSVNESIYTLIYEDKLTDEQIADGVEAYRYEYIFRWGDNLEECCIKTVNKTLITESDTVPDTDTDTDSDIDTGTDTDTGSDTDTGTDSETDTDTVTE